MADYSTTFSATLTGGTRDQQLTFVGSTTLDFSVASGGTVSGTADFQVTDPTFFDLQVSGTSPISGTTSDIQTSDRAGPRAERSQKHIARAGFQAIPRELAAARV